MSSEELRKLINLVEHAQQPKQQLKEFSVILDVVATLLGEVVALIVDTRIDQQEAIIADAKLGFNPTLKKLYDDYVDSSSMGLIKHSSSIGFLRYLEHRVKENSLSKEQLVEVKTMLAGWKKKLIDLIIWESKFNTNK